MANEYLDVPATRGAMRFRSNAFTGTTTCGLQCAMADFLLGYVSDFQLSNVWVVEQRHWATMFFVQDDWKVTSQLSLNLGLRYDFITPALRGEQRADQLRSRRAPAAWCSPATARSRSAGWSSRTRTTSRPAWAWSTQLDDKTVIRGGWGIFYNLFDRVGSEDQLALNVPGTDQQHR